MTEEQNTNETTATQTPEPQAAPAAEPAAPAFDPQDIEKNKVMAGLAYILFFLPLVVCPESKFGRFHANQGLVLLIAGVVGSIVLTIIPIIGWILLPLFGIAVTVFVILGLINGLTGKDKALPLIGKIKIIK